MTWGDLQPAASLRTLAIALAGAALFMAVGFPAAPLTGPAAAVSLATIFGFKTHVPDIVRDACFLILGVNIGSSVTPEVIATALRWPLSLLVLTGSLIVTLYAVQAALIRAFRFDRITALLAATPGHLSYVIGLSTDLRANVPNVVLVQSIRVLLLTLVVPVVIAAWGVEGATPGAAPGRLPVLPLAATVALGLGLGLILKRLRVPAALLLGTMLVSAVGHGSDLTPGIPPVWLTLAAFVVMGGLIGTRFNGVARADVVAALGAGVMGTALACAIATAGGWVAAGLVGLPAPVLMLAFAPGGVEVMAALAVETGLEPAFVAAHHVIRLLILTALLPMVMAAERRRMSR